MSNFQHYLEAVGKTTAFNKNKNLFDEDGDIIKTAYFEFTPGPNSEDGFNCFTYDDSTITLSNIAFVSGQTTLFPIDGNWVIKNVASTSFDIVDTNGNNPSDVTGTYLRKESSFVKKAFFSTWESEIMDLGGKGSEIEYQTPVTPWFVSDFDDNGTVKRLFRVWSISDGEAANIEIKIEILNILSR